ncbi:hypothetical protein QN277_011188 [Acacia crassicarpa]|uniref:Uncharacterized protein n=1 Tax=Acacia crassicarpa TaxID=499986 RepID=A0AAE1MYD1_9FABA|nr:hypothetical protein QN277_011188 [Acacia crassicarpa]
MADDPFVFMIEDCQIPSSQEEILRDCPLLGQPINSPGDGVTSILPEIAQDAGEDRVCRDVFVTPPEEQSYFSPCVCHKAVQTDDESVTQGFDYFTRYADGAMSVDLGDDSDLRFSLDELNLMTDTTMVAGCSFWNDGARGIEISNGKKDKFQVSGRELSPNDTIGEPRHKRMKALEQNLGFKSSQACSEIEPQKIGDDLQICEATLVSNQKGPCNSVADPRCQENIQIGSDKENDFVGISVEKNLGSGENLGNHLTPSGIASTEEYVENIESKEQNCEAEKLAGISEGNKKVNETAETSENNGSGKLTKLRIIAERLKDITKGKSEDEKAVSFVFDVFKALTTTEDSEKEDNLENVSFLELARSRGFTFPTPWWWMDTNT